MVPKITGSIQQAAQKKKKKKKNRKNKKGKEKQQLMRSHRFQKTKKRIHREWGELVRSIYKVSMLINPSSFGK